MTTPLAVTFTGNTDIDGAVHVVCCNPDLAACGSDRTGQPFLPDDAEATCPICAIADAEELPCGDPDCPFREECAS